MFPATLEHNSTEETYRNMGSVESEYRMDQTVVQRARERSAPNYAYPAVTLQWLTEALEQRYEFADKVAIERFLRESPFLFGLLLGAQQKIRDYFDPNTTVVLRVVRDPEVREDERLFVFIQTELPPEEALARLSELDDGWWLEALSGARHKMTIDVEYV